MSIASPTRENKAPRTGSPWGRMWRGTLQFGTNQYRRISSASLRGVALLLTLIAIGMTSFGVIMVLSASSVEQISSGLSPFSQVSRQALFAIVGLIVLAIMAMVPVHWYRRKSVLYALVALSILIQLLTVIIGKDVNGNRNWIVLGPVQLQPSEFSKLIFALWGGWVLAHQGDISRQPRKGLFPLFFGFGPLVLFILMGHDVGTIIVYALMLLALLWFAGFSNKAMALGIGAAALAGSLAVFTSANRIARVMGTLGHCEGATCDQANAGLAALATGGFWGVGLGRSRQKYNYLPEAHNDYIFAIVGEELGLIGTLLIILLYLGLVYCCIRIMVRTADRFIALTTGAIMVWLMGQAMINIAMVTGFLPVIGIPLPLISYGGSSLVTSLAAIGVLIAFARQTPLLPVISNDGAYYYAGATDMKDEKRRRPLGQIVTQENKKLTQQGDRAGWDIKKFLQTLSMAVGQKTSPPPRKPANRSKPTTSSPRGTRTASSSAPVGARKNKNDEGRRRAPAQPRATKPAPPRKTQPKAKASPTGQRRQASRNSAEGTPNNRETSRTTRKGTKNQQTRRPQSSGTSSRSSAQKQSDPLPEGLVPLKKIRQQNKKSQ